MKIAVIGASGFVGATLVERLLRQRRGEVVPFIHTTGNAGRIARLGIPLKMLDLMDRRAIAQGMAGFTHVVNCSRGGNDVMLGGLRNLLEACRFTGIRRLVHLSSVAAYGDPPSPDSVTEAGHANPVRGTYGWLKLEQDKLVAGAATRGLSSIALCPPNISGAYSGYLEMIFHALKRGELALLDKGLTPCNLVDVCNLSHAIELALDHGPADGRRLFVTDNCATTWRDVIDGLRPLLGDDVEVPEIERDELIRLCAKLPSPRVSVRKSLLHLISSDVRQALRKDPLWARLDAAMRKSARIFGRTVEDRLRLTVEGPARVACAGSAPKLNVHLCAQQLRGITHSCDQAKKLLQYQPLYSFQQSMAAFCRWYRALHGWDTPVAPLLNELG